MTKVSKTLLIKRGHAGTERLAEFEIFRYNLIILQATKQVSATELSKLMNLRSIKRIEDYKLGRVHPTWDEIRAICKFFDVTIDQMMYKKCIVKFADGDSINTQICSITAAVIYRLFKGNIISHDDCRHLMGIVKKIKSSPQV